MGLRDRIHSWTTPRVDAPTVTTQSTGRFAQRVIFQNEASLHAFHSDLTYGTFLNGAAFNDLARHHGGFSLRSQTGKELLVYRRLPRVLQMTRDYLIGRDATAKMLAFTPARDSLAEPPSAPSNATVDAFLRTNWHGLGLGRALVAARGNAYYTGGSLLYLRAGGESDTPLERGDRWFEWTHIPAHLVIDEPNDANRGIQFTDGAELADPTLAHGISSISFWLSDDDKARDAEPVRAHGSRIWPVNLDPESRAWRSPRVPLDAHVDDLEDYRDIKFGRAKGHFQGDPIVAEFDLSKDAIDALSLHTITAEEEDDMLDAVSNASKQFRTAHTDTFAPVRGIKYKRLGSQDLKDPAPDIATIAANLSHDEPFTAEMILSSTKGSRSEGMEDDLRYERGCNAHVRFPVAVPVIHQALRLAQRTQQFGITRAVSESPPPLVWPRMVPQTPRDDAFTLSQRQRVLRGAWEMGRLAPPAIEVEFPTSVAGGLPPVFALRGKKEDGTDAQPPEPPSSQAPPSNPNRGARAATHAEVEAIVEERLRLELDAMLDEGKE